METSYHVHHALSEMAPLTCRAQWKKNEPEDLPPPRAAGDRKDPWLDATPRPEPLPSVHFFPFFLLDLLVPG